MKNFRHAVVVLLLGLWWLGSFVIPVYADSVSLSVTPISQRFWPSDPNGDIGTYDCMAAALAVSLAALSSSGGSELDTHKISYSSIRRDARIIQPDYTTGILPRTLISMTPSLTDDTYRMLYHRVEPSGWESFLRRELNKSYPVIVIVSDRFALFSPLSDTPASHVIVVTGIDDKQVYFADSWDGGAHSVTYTAFSRAWGKGDNAWLALTFVKRPHAVTFHDVMMHTR